MRRCKDSDLECFLAELSKPDQPWFAQEVAAINAARLAPGDARVAEAITVAYATLDPDLRTTLAWLAGHMLEGKRCETCAQNLRLTLEGSDAPKRLTPDYQLSVLMGRTAIAKLRE